MPDGRLGPDDYALFDTVLADADEALTRRYPGDAGTRQPVHTVYVPADRYRAGTVADCGRQALDLLDQHAATPADLARVAGVDPALAAQVHRLVRDKLVREPIEDLRIDFEDGFGRRPDDVEDAAAVRAGALLRDSLLGGTAPPFCGIRFKSLEAATRRRGVRTLDLFLGALCKADGRLPHGFVVTLPKVSSVEQTAAMVALCERVEQAHGLAADGLRFELQIETPQAIIGMDGSATVARMIQAAAGRCAGLHYGTYDYSASLGIAAGFQSMDHPAADHARAVMQVAAAGTGVRLSDGSTNVLPVGGPEDVARAWQLHARLVRRSLERGFYQGWDLHPGQLVTRFAATYAFYRSGFAASAARLNAYLNRTDSGVLDEPATAAALAGFLVRGLQCGALDPDEVRAGSGVAPDQLVALRLGSEAGQ